MCTHVCAHSVRGHRKTSGILDSHSLPNFSQARSQCRDSGPLPTHPPTSGLVASTFGGHSLSAPITVALRSQVQT